MRNEDVWSVQFVTMDGRFHSLDQSQLRSVIIQPGSIMPTDYELMHSGVTLDLS
jgi:hypothetical protein